MGNESTFSETSYSREYFAKLVDKLRTETDVRELITFYGTLSGVELELAAPSFCLLAEKCLDSMRELMMNIVHRTLTGGNSRSARKAAYACLKVLTRDQESIWSDFLILCQCLEEPQFHLINPVLSRFDNIMQLVYSERIDFEWAMVVFTRAFAHSNGWVRLWALERLITIQPRTMAVNHDYFLSVLVNQLNSNEAFWRLLIRGNLRPFLHSLGGQIIGILSSLDYSSKELFLRKILRTVTEMSSPSSIFFVSYSLMEVRTMQCLHLDDIPLAMVLLQKTRNIQHTTIKLAALFNFVVFFSKIIRVNPEVANKIGCLTAFFSKEDQSLLNRFIEMKSSQAILQSTIEHVEVVQFVLQHRPNFEKDDFAALLWVRAHLSGQDGSLKMVIEKELADRLVNVEERFERLFSSITEAVDTLLTILFAYKEELLPVSHGLDQLIQRYILLRCTTVSYSGHEMFMVHNVYAGIWKRLGLSFKSLVDLCLSLISEKEISVDRHCFLLRILYDAFDHLTNHEVEGVIPAILRYFGTNPLVPMEHPKSVMFRCEKDANKLFSTVHEYRLKVLIKFLPNVVRMDDEQILLRCADQLALASSYPVAQCYLEILQMFIDRVKCSNTLLVVVEAAIVLTKEEKKSQHFLPSLRSVLR